MTWAWPRAAAAVAALLAALPQEGAAQSWAVPGLPFGRGGGALDGLEDLREALSAAAPGELAAEAAVRTLSTLLEGLDDAGLVLSSHYNAGRQSADFRLRGGGATGTVPPQFMVWFSFHVAKRLQVRWEKVKGGGLNLEVSGLKIWPLDNAHDFYETAGLDEWVCPLQAKSTRKEYYTCHLNKALRLEELWFADRSQFPQNLVTHFRQLADRELLMRVAHQLGHGFGWSMLLVLSAPPSDIHTLEFTERGVSALTSLDKSLKGAKLAERHHFKDLALDIARPLLGDTRFGSLIRDVGERFLRAATNFAVLLSVGEPRWRPRNLKPADSAAIADMFQPRHHSVRGTHGTVTWLSHREHQHQADSAFGLWPGAALANRAPPALLPAPCGGPGLAEPRGEPVTVQAAVVPLLRVAGSPFLLLALPLSLLPLRGLRGLRARKP